MGVFTNIGIVSHGVTGYSSSINVLSYRIKEGQLGGLCSTYWVERRELMFLIRKSERKSVKVKVKFTLEQATKAQGVRRFIDLLFL